MSHFFSLILRLYKNNLGIKIVRVSLAAIIFSLAVYTVYPMFTGELISPSMRVTTPAEYFDAFKWFKNKPGRVAQFPMDSMWGWQYNKWGYQGAGFFWFGIENPYLTRDFDRWSAANETFYIRASAAAAAGDISTLDRVLSEFNVSYLVFDESIFSPGNTNTQSEVQKMLEAKYGQAAQFGFIKIYKTPYGEALANALPTYTEVASDETYSAILPPIPNRVSSPLGVSYPFLNTDARVGTKVLYEVDGVRIDSPEISKGTYNLQIPHFVEKESYLPMNLSVAYTENSVEVRMDLVTPEIIIDGKAISQDPVYMKYSLPTRNTTAGSIALNGQIFDISKKPTGRLGTVIVPREGLVQLELFGLNAAATTTFTEEIQARTASFCSDETKQVTTKKKELGFEIEVAEDSVCLGNGFEVREDSLVTVSYKTAGALSPFFCVNQLGVEGCVNKNFPISVGDKSYQNSVALKTGSYWFVFVAQSQPSKTNVSYQGIRVSTAKRLASIPVAFGDGLTPFVRSSIVEVNVTDSLSVRYPVTSMVSEDWNLARGHSQAFNCDIAGRGEVYKTVLTEGVNYRATGEGVSCDYFDYRNLAPDRSFIVRLGGENNDGRSMKLYLSNSESNRVDLEALLGSNSFDQSYIVHPVGASTKGYVANLETRSFGRVSADNTLTNLSLYYLPYNWLSSITLARTNNQPQGGSVEVRKIDQFGPATLIQIDSPTGGVVTLNQAYEAGWVGITNGHVLPHVKINGWQNGWKVPEGTNTVIVLFWPQILEYLGFALLSFYLIYYLRKGL